MRLFSRIGIQTCVLLCFMPVSVAAHGDVEHASIVVTVTDAGFSPEELTVTVGETVTFENNGQTDVWPASDTHPTHEEYPELDPRKPLIPNEAWSFTFDELGTWSMHDHLNPERMMTVRVEAADTDDTGGSYVEKVLSALVNLYNKVLSWFTNPPAVQSTENLSAETPRKSLHTDFTRPEPYSSQFIAEYASPCSEDDVACIKTELGTITSTYGPTASSLALKRWLNEGVVAQSVNDHQLSHDIGRDTARVFGVNPQSFKLCPTDMFNGGCQHGFFEYVLGRTDSTTAAADAICTSLDDSYSDKFKFYCYHGVGHGVMMQQAYDLEASLAICDSLDAQYAQVGCWQGVFMENTNAALTGYVKRDGVFSDEDPLAPCNTVDPEYRQQCYLNHAGYLMQYFDNGVEAATNSCLQADEWISDCIQSIGLMVTNPSWQPALHSEATQQNEIDTALILCQEFPRAYEQDCVLGAIDNITNFDGLDVSRAHAFCGNVSDAHADLCYTRLGNNLRTSTADPAAVTKACNTLPTAKRTLCL